MNCRKTAAAVQWCLASRRASSHRLRVRGVALGHCPNFTQLRSAAFRLAEASEVQKRSKGTNHLAIPASPPGSAGILAGAFLKDLNDRADKDASAPSHD